MEENGSGLLERTNSIFMEGRRKTTEILVTITNLRTEIWTRDLPNMKQDCNHTAATFRDWKS
jgi:hypothetical protein